MGRRERTWWPIGGVIALLVVWLVAMALTQSRLGRLMSGDASDGVGEARRTRAPDVGGEGREILTGDSGSQGAGVGAERGVAIAAQHIGLTATEGPQPRSQLVVPRGDNTPFVHRFINGRLCWSVSFYDVPITIRVIPPGELGLRGQRVSEARLSVQNLNALVDVDTGKLLKVWSAERIRSEFNTRTAAQADDAVLRRSGERWEGLPDHPPRISLLRAIWQNRIHPRMEQLDAVYVLIDGRPCWVVTGESSDPYARGRRTSLGPGQKPPAVSGWRVSVDADTGAPLRGTDIY